MSDIFREVEEDIRREQLKRLWDRFGIYVILVAVLIVAGTAAWRGWQWYSARQAAAAGQTYHQAVELARGGAHEEARAAFSAIAQDRGPFSTLARLRAAAALAAAGDTEGAAAAYDAIAGDGGVERTLRDLARIRAGYLLIDTAERAEIEERVEGLASEASAWRHSARELLGLAAYREGDYGGAAQRFQEILSDQETPQDLRTRAQLMMSLVAAARPVGANAAASAENGAGVQ